MIRLAILVLITLTLGNATPAHIYKSFPPERKAYATSVQKKTVPSVPVAQVAVQAENPVAQAAPAPSAPAITDVVNCGSDPYMAYIYSHESGCSTTRTNSIGCVGLGQACPGSKLYAVCPTLTWDCENSFFVTYANARYGSPYQAYLVWLNQHWW